MQAKITFTLDIPKDMGESQLKNILNDTNNYQLILINDGIKIKNINWAILK